MLKECIQQTINQQDMPVKRDVKQVRDMVGQQALRRSSKIRQKYGVSLVEVLLAGDLKFLMSASPQQKKKMMGLLGGRDITGMLG